MFRPRAGAFLLLCLLQGGPVFAQDDNLVTNGDFSQLPPRSSPGTAEHAAVFLIPVSAGSQAIPGWSVRSTVWACLWKNGQHSLNLRDSSAVSQTLSTIPGRKYLFSVVTGLDSEGQHPQDLLVVAGRIRHVFKDIGKPGPTDFEFIADSTNTRLELSGSAPGLGPFLLRVSVSEVNPERTAALTAIKAFYRQMDKALTANSNESSSNFLSSDFSSTSKSGDTQEGSAWWDALQKLQCRRTTTLIRQAIPDGEGGWTLTVERRLTVEGEKGPRVLRLTESFKKNGDGWLLKSSKEE
jgi:hypothetical protein